MKLKNLFQILGFRSSAKRYLYKINKFDIENGIEVNYAQWLHPSESQKVISQEQVNAYREVLEEGDFCIDIGAHTGDNTLPIAIATGLKGSPWLLSQIRSSTMFLKKMSEQIATLRTLRL